MIIIYLPRTSCCFSLLKSVCVASPLLALHEYFPPLERLRGKPMVLLVPGSFSPSLYHRYSQPEATPTLQVKFTASPTYIGLKAGFLLSLGFGVLSETQKTFYKILLLHQNDEKPAQAHEVEY